MANLKSASTAPDNKKYGYTARKYHGKDPGLYGVKKDRLNKAVKAYKKKQYSMAAWQLGIALHTVQDFWAHNVKDNVWGWIYYQQYYILKGDRRHKWTFDYIGKNYNGKQWVAIYYMNNPRVHNSWNSTYRLLCDFKSKVR